MKPTSSLLGASLVASLVVGLGGAVAAYRATTDDLPSLDAPTTVTAAAATSASPQVVRPGARFRWAPCVAGAALEKGVCVRDVVQTIVVPAPAPAPVPAAAPAPAYTGGGGGGGSDDGGASYSEGDEQEDEGEDDDRDEDEDDDRDEDEGEDDDRDDD